MPDIPLLLEAETPADFDAIERLNERVFGPGRFARTAYRLRETTPHDLSLSFIEPVFRSQGIGEALVTRSLEAAKAAGAKLSILVGDEPYYSRMGFKRAPPGRLQMPGPVDPARLLYCEIAPGAFEGVKGRVRGA